MNIFTRIFSKKFDSKRYWKSQYESGGSSGAGSYGELADYKAGVINSVISELKIQDIIELGSGDGNQIGLVNINNYTGYDISETAVSMCNEKYKDDSRKSFKLMSQYDKDFTSDMSMSLEVIFHLVEDEVFNEYMEKLFNSAKKFVLIFSSNSDENEGFAKHVRNRKFTAWIDRNKGEFILKKQIETPISFSKGSVQSHFYLFEKLN